VAGGGSWGRKIFPSEENFTRLFGFALFAYMKTRAKNHARSAKKTPHSPPCHRQKDAPFTPLPPWLDCALVANKPTGQARMRAFKILAFYEEEIGL